MLCNETGRVRGSRVAVKAAMLLVLAACAAPEVYNDGRRRAAPATEDRPPNILLIVADDLGYADLGFTGCEDIPTPHLDQLAAEGVFCKDAHVTASVCAPSRAGMLTGRYQQRGGFEANLRPGNGLLDGTVTLPMRLQDLGYSTAAVGKWHVGYEAHNHPLEVGFDRFTGLLAGSRSYFPIQGKKPSLVQRIERNREPVPEDEFSYLTDFLTDEGASIIDEHGGAGAKPLFLYMSYTAPHGPMHARPDLLDRFASIEPKGRRAYAAMVAALDEGVGELRAALMRAGMADNTLIVFLSDNGGATNNHSDNGPWRGMKGSKWEGGQRVPMVFHWPNRLPPSEMAEVVSSLDLAPTFVAAAGGSIDAGETDGMNVVDRLWRPSRLSESTFMWRTLFWRRSVVAAVRDEDWKLIRVREEDGSMRAPILVDVGRDPGETVNRALDEPDLVEELGRMLDAWEEELMEPRWMTGDIWRKNQRLKHEFDLVGRDAERRLP